jgi:crotonobetainyl-CoA:carnitine CoA-transferase CaiB-like acyl-CoA transferase
MSVRESKRTARGAYRRSRRFPVHAIANRSGFDFAFVRPELIDDPRYDTAEASSRNSEEVVAPPDEAIGARDMAEWEPLFRREGLVWGLSH